MSHFFEEEQPPRRRRGSRTKSIVAVVVAVLVLVGGGWFAVDRLGGALLASDYSAGTAQEPVTVTIPSGATLTDMAGILADARVVESQKAFVRVARSDERATAIQAGDYRLATHLSAKEALAALLDPASKVAEQITLREGLTLQKQLDAIAEQSGIPRAQFAALAKDPSTLGLPSYAKGLEGYLFPDTYQFGDKTSAEQILRTMVDQYKTVAAQVGLEQAAASMGRNPADVVTVASIVEAEVFNEGDRAKVARVVYNRLDKGMPLQLDTTVKYVNGLDGKVTTTDQERVKDSPYNTYLHAGLPPGPIGAPGKAALDAAAHPAAGSWLYFVAVNMETGETKFATTFEEHNKYVAEFQSWCQANKAKGLC
ncbi:UPF0755 protein [Raineyella antarctica]|uniref:Endolytic murein transglycosylase n=1 Tax=Raineyella antarctica TaxID=1577474 RepID=A0A1G6HIZ7_9ACTN|nr:endolytic transglycosylase MltG [Raineyella antarctica]SDB94123.1 UPF0755 protein [Raineyella antarctica]